MLLNVLDYQSPTGRAGRCRQRRPNLFSCRCSVHRPLGGWKIIKSLELFGDGMGISSFGSILRAFDKDSPVIEVADSCEERLPA